MGEWVGGKSEGMEKREGREGRRLTKKERARKCVAEHEPEQRKPACAYVVNDLVNDFGDVKNVA